MRKALHSEVVEIKKNKYFNFPMVVAVLLIVFGIFLNYYSMQMPKFYEQEMYYNFSIHDSGPVGMELWKEREIMSFGRYMPGMIARSKGSIFNNGTESLYLHDYELTGNGTEFVDFYFLPEIIKPNTTERITLELTIPSKYILINDTKVPIEEFNQTEFESLGNVTYVDTPLGDYDGWAKLKYRIGE